jgi:hypothetical protein
VYSEPAESRRYRLSRLTARLTQEPHRAEPPYGSEIKAMDTNTLLIIVVVIFLFGGFGFYGRGRWF